MHIALQLKLIAIAVIALVILLIIALRRKQKRLVFPLVAFIVLGTGLGIWEGLSEYNRTNADLAKVKDYIMVSASDLIGEYEADDSLANEKYLGKVVEINGKVKKVEQDEKGYYTVVVGDTGRLSSVRCSMDTIHNDDAARLAPESSVYVRGACTGFTKDVMGLGSDVILNRCAIITKKD